MHSNGREFTQRNATGDGNCMFRNLSLFLKTTTQNTVHRDKEPSVVT
jgi:hypothetical protein